MKRLIIISSFTVLFILFCIAIYGFLVLKLSVPRYDGQEQISSLHDSVEITFDKMGLPQIWAKAEKDAYFAFGYLHAADRLFQMDLTRRAALGRLSELLGVATIEIDKQQRIIGHKRLAQNYLDQISESNRQRLQAYCDGINYYVRECAALPFEYQLLREDFEEWTIFDCLAILSFQTWFSDFLMSPDQFFAELVDKVGIEKAYPINIPYPSWAPTIVPQENQRLSLKSYFQEALYDQLFGNQTLPFLMSNASNSWVVAPQHSATGSALLASDPHLEISRLPQFWYYLGLHIKNKGIDALGISTPGLPVIIMGHNTRVAWAFTVSGVDVSEYYIEKINPHDSTQYLTPQGWQSFESFEERINISGQADPLLFKIRKTRHGPVVLSADSIKQIYSLHWAGYDVDLNEGIWAGFQLLETANFGDFQKTVTKLGALDASWTYADAAGNIGYQLGTPVVIRPKSNNNFPVPGWTDEYHWQGFYPLGKTPFSYNPPRGWLATCNNKPDQSNLDYELEGYFAYDRILRIEELLSHGEKFSVSDMQNFQMDLLDRYLLRWRDLIIPYLKKLNQKKWTEQLQVWNGVSDLNSTETALIVVFIHQLKHEIFDDELKDRRTKISPLTIETLLNSTQEAWFDNIRTPDKIETKEEIIQSALYKTLNHLQNKNWGDLHTLKMEHPLALIPLLNSLLNLSYGPVPWPGTAGTLNASFFLEDKNKPGYFNSLVGPSWRFVIDFVDVDGATMVLPAGNSGNPMSPHFMDFLEMWKNGGRWNVPIHYEKVKERAKSTLILKP